MSNEFKAGYDTASVIAILISAIGWLTLVGGGYLVFFSNSAGSMPPELKIYGTAFALFMGFSFIVTGQMMRAIIDNTNANKEILHILKSKQYCGTFATDSQLD